MSDTGAKQACRVLEARNFISCVCEVREGHLAPGQRWEEWSPDFQLAEPREAGRAGASQEVSGTGQQGTQKSSIKVTTIN